MNLGSLAGGTCRICGSDTMGADIGCSCKKLYDRATFIVLRKHDKISLEYNYSIGMRYYMDMFCREYEEKLAKHNGNIAKMYKNEFNRQFFPSVYNQYKEKGYVSKKQLEIVIKKMFPLGCGGGSKVYMDIEKRKKEYISAFVSEYDFEIVEVTKNLWKSKKVIKN